MRVGGARGAEQEGEIRVWDVELQGEDDVEGQTQEEKEVLLLRRRSEAGERK